MDVEVLRTKHYRVPPSHLTLHRERLLDEVYKVLACRVTLVTTLLQQPGEPSPARLSHVLANTLSLFPHKVVLVFDDLHLIDDTAILALLTSLVQDAPPTLHLVLSTRSDPPLPLNRWRARHLQ